MICRNLFNGSGISVFTLDREQKLEKKSYSLKMLLQNFFFFFLTGHTPYDHIKVFQHNTLYTGQQVSTLIALKTSLNQLIKP